MSMSTSSSQGVRSEINITPLVDVVLVLLIIFMVATPILQMGLDVEVPPKVEVTGAPPPSEQNQLVITVRTDGIYLNTLKLANAKALRDALTSQMLGRAMADIEHSTFNIRFWPYSTFRANWTLGSCVVLSVVEP